MKIAWATPWPPEVSAIGQYSAVVLAELRKHVEVDLWVPETSTETYQAINAEIYQLSPLAADVLKKYDIVIYNMGNNLRFHREIYEISRIVPGIIILHDVVLHHFFAGYYLEYLKDPLAYLAAMESEYGLVGRDLASSIIDGKRTAIWEQDQVVDYPLNSRVLSASIGVVVHSDYAKQSIESVYKGPIKRLPFPGKLVPSVKTDIISRVRKLFSIPEGKLVLLTVGQINRNKCFDFVLKVLALYPEVSERLVYLIVGEQNDAHYNLERMIKAWDLEGTVRGLGYQPDEIVNALYNIADVGLLLRYPTMGESSWGVVQMLAMGVPCIVSDVGWYSELESGVIKLSTDRGSDQLRKILHSLIEDREVLKKLGREAQEYSKAFNASAFCQQLLPFLEETRSLKPAYHTFFQVANCLRDMGLVPTDQALLDPIVNTLGDIIG